MAPLTPATRKDTILVIDDNPDNLFVLKELITDTLPDAVVLTAAGAAAGLALAVQHSVDGILTDVQMPHINGIDLCRQLKQHPDTAHIPVILMTAHSTTASLKARGLEAGADDFILKPVDNVELIARIKAILRIKHAEDGLRARNEVLEEEVMRRTQALWESQEQLSSLLNTMTDAVWSICLQTFRVLHLNPAAETLYVRPLAALAASTEAWREQIADPGDQRLAEDSLAHLLADSRWEGEYRITRPGGEVRWVYDRASLIRNADGAPVRIDRIVTDVTERKRAEENLRQSQKMEAIGQLAGGVAHDFNNLLTAILGYANMLREESAPDTTVHESAAIIEHAAERASELTRQLLGFARRGKFLSVPVSINSSLREVIKLLARTMDKNITIARELCAPRVQVLGDPGQIEQVILNLAVNARDAMPEGGTLTIRSDIIVLSEEDCRGQAESQPGQFVMVEVTDTGCGIPLEIRDRIFEPFFTTKEKGSGTGMGLAMVYGIVHNHNGWLQILSEPGQGTTMRVYLPYHATAEESGPSGTGGAPHRGNGRILLIDDEEVILKVCSQMLRSLGYTVDVAADAREAIALYRRQREAIDLVIVDMIMPEMDGRQCYHELKKINPALRAVLSSGYSMDGKVQQILGEGLRGFIQKPFKLSNIAEMVARVLSED